MKIEEKKSGETAREYAYNTIRDNIISLELDNEMHKKLFSICRKELTYNMCQRLAIHYDRIRSLSVTTVKDYKIIGEHRELLDAIRSKDTKRAVETMDRHLNNWMLNEKLFREQYPQYFK